MKIPYSKGLKNSEDNFLKRFRIGLLDKSKDFKLHQS